MTHLKFSSSIEMFKKNPQKMLTEDQFRDIARIKIDPFFFSPIWQTVVGDNVNRVMLVKGIFLKSFGYEFGSGYEMYAINQFKIHLDLNGIPFIHDTFSNLESNIKINSIELKQVKNEWDQLEPCNQSSTKFFLIYPRDFRIGLMVLKTGRAKQIKEMFIDLETIHQKYYEYTKYFELNKITKEKDDLMDEINQKLDKLLKYATTTY